MDGEPAHVRAANAFAVSPAVEGEHVKSARAACRRDDVAQCNSRRREAAPRCHASCRQRARRLGAVHRTGVCRTCRGRCAHGQEQRGHIRGQFTCGHRSRLVASRTYAMGARKARSAEAEWSRRCTRCCWRRRGGGIGPCASTRGSCSSRRRRGEGGWDATPLSVTGTYLSPDAPDSGQISDSYKDFASLRCSGHLEINYLG